MFVTSVLRQRESRRTPAWRLPLVRLRNNQYDNGHSVRKIRQTMQLERPLVDNPGLPSWKMCRERRSAERTGERGVIHAAGYRSARRPYAQGPPPGAVSAHAAQGL